MTPTLIAITGPSASGKDTLGKNLAELLSEKHRVQLISGSALFRSAALYALEKRYDPKKPLPHSAFADIELLPIEFGKVKVSQHENQVIYSPSDYSRANVGTAGSDYARHSPDIYKTFVISVLCKYIDANTSAGRHSILPARDALSIASKTETPSLCVYLALSLEAKLKRLDERFRLADSRTINEDINKELKRDLQDIASGTLPEDSTDFITLSGQSSYRSHTTYRLDTSNQTVEQSTTALLRAARMFIEKH